MKHYIKSFGYAFTGLRTLFSERNIGIHAIATIIVIAAGLWKGLQPVEWCFILFAIALVWISEAFNTAIERLSNVVSKEYHPVIKQVKDISAAGVLIAVIIAVMVGLIVFIG